MLIEVRLLPSFFSSILIRKDRKQNKNNKVFLLNHILLKWQKIKVMRCLLVLHIYILRGVKGVGKLISLFLPCYLNFSFSNFLLGYWVSIYFGFLDLFSFSSHSGMVKISLCNCWQLSLFYRDLYANHVFIYDVIMRKYHIC